MVYVIEKFAAGWQFVYFGNKVTTFLRNFHISTMLIISLRFCPSVWYPDGLLRAADSVIKVRKTVNLYNSLYENICYLCKNFSCYAI